MLLDNLDEKKSAYLGQTVNTGWPKKATSLHTSKRPDPHDDSQATSQPQAHQTDRGGSFKMKFSDQDKNFDFKPIENLIVSDEFEGFSTTSQNPRSLV